MERGGEPSASGSCPGSTGPPAQGGSSPRTRVQGCPLWLERQGLGLVKGLVHSFLQQHSFYQLCDGSKSLKHCTSGSRGPGRVRAAGARWWAGPAGPSGPTRVGAVLWFVIQSYPTLRKPINYSPPGSSVHRDSPGKNTGVCCHTLLQGVFPNQGLNLGLPHCKRILYHLSH